MATEAVEPFPDPSLPTWSLCVATLNRIDVLEQSVALAVRQEPPPREVIVVDASDGWEENRDRIERLIGTGGGAPRLCYIAARERSLTNQRNQALPEATSDILFLFDDDTLMLPGCAREILRVYAADSGGRVAAVGGFRVDRSPLSSGGGGLRQAGADRQAERHAQSLLPAGLWRWLSRHVFLFDLESRFIAYAPEPDRPTSAEVTALGLGDVAPVQFLNGFRMTVRREVAMREPFEAALLAYCPAEDLDATYRFARHGWLLVAKRAELYHVEAAAGRLKRRQVPRLTSCNIAFILRKRSRALWRDMARYYVLQGRMLLSALLRDLAGRRWSLPSCTGLIAAIPDSVRIFRLPEADLDERYRSIQKRIL